MRTYTVHHIDDDPRTIVELADDVVFVKDGFSWPAFFIPMFWLIYRGMWIVLIGYIAVLVVSSTLLGFLGVDDTTSFVVGLAVSLLMGFEGNDLLRWTLSRSGLRAVAVVQAGSIEDAERRFFQGMIEAAGHPLPEVYTEVRKSRPTVSHPARAGGVWGSQGVDDEEQIVGLFPRPEGKA